MLDDFYKVGQVIEVRGQKVRIKVFENKNSNIFIYNGKIIKNVSVGGFVKIPKGYNCIVARIEGEYIQENYSSDNRKTHFLRESENISRVIEVKVMGVLENNRFIRGLVDIPLVFADAYLLMDDEVKRIFQFSKKPQNSIPIGTINDYKEEKLYVDASALFASHIGIFGNTGSGKSNTLAKLYTEAVRRFRDGEGFSKSRFIIIDFNGEYINAFTEDKDVFRLTTRREDGDRIPLPESFFFDNEIWTIVCEATEKTQKPFLNRALRTYRKIAGAEDQTAYVKEMIRNLINGFFNHPENYVHLAENLVELLNGLFGDNSEEAKAILYNLQVRNNGETLHNNRDDTWGNSMEEYENSITAPILASIFQEGFQLNVENFDILEFSIRYKFIEEVYNRKINEEHIAPMVNRFRSRRKSMEKLFVAEDEDNHLNTIAVFSLLDVNVEFRKIVPLIICKYYYEKHKEGTEGSLHIILDEAHNILSTSSERESQVWKDYRLETFEEIIKEGRKFSTFLTIASQRPADISETIISQLHNYFIHRLVNNEDIRAIGKAVSFIDSTSYEMISVLPQGACIFTGIASNFPVLVQIDLLEESLRPNSDTIDLVKLWEDDN